MQILYYLLIFIIVVSAIIAILMAAGVLHIEVHTNSNPDDLQEEIRKQFDDETEEDKKE